MFGKVFSVLTETRTQDSQHQDHLQSVIPETTWLSISYLAGLLSSVAHGTHRAPSTSLGTAPV